MPPPPANPGTLGVVEQAALSDVGRRREGNEDSYLAAAPVFVVADGMGGAQAGEVASGTAIEVLQSAAAEGSLPAELEATIAAANERVHGMARADPSLRGMGTTLTAAVVTEGGELVIGHVGDSRAYRLRDGELEQLTEDHSLVGELVRLGELSAADAEHHPQRSVILRAIGIEPRVQSDIERHELADGDVYLLCSDGLNGMVRDEVIAETLRALDDLDDAAAMLVDLANEFGGHDNITAVLFRVGPGR